MTWKDAVSQLINSRGNLRIKELCDDSHPDHLYWRSRAVEMVQNLPAGSTVTAKKSNRAPPLRQRIRNLAGSMAEWAKDGFKLARSKQVQSRKAVCEGCDQFDRASKRCRRCGCGVQGVVALKPYLRSAKCPLDKWDKPTPP